MAENWRRAESRVKPDEIDKKSTASGIYVRKNIEKITSETETGEIIEKYTYLECLMSETEYNNYFLQQYIVKNVLDEDDSIEFQIYKEKLDQPVQYTNGFYYKPKWAEKVYEGLIERGLKFAQLFPMRIYDASEKYENSVEMTVEELIQLTMFLAAVQEQYFKEYKEAKTKQEE